MAFQGFEANRGFCGTLKYRCPAAAFGFECACRDACHRAGGVEPGEYGRHRAHRSRQSRPAHLHPHAVGQPVVAARLQAAFCDGADQQPHRPGLRLRDPLHPRPCQDEGPYRAGAGGDDGAGIGAGAGRPATPSGCARWSAWCRCATPADASSAFRHRRSTRPAAGRRNPAATLATVFPHCSDLAWNRRILLARQDQADDIRPHPTGNAPQKNATAHMPLPS